MVDMKWRMKRNRFALWWVKFRFCPYLGWDRKCFVWNEAQVWPLTWLGIEISHRNETQVCALILIRRKMKYLFEWGSGLYPYPDWAENGIPHQRRFRFVPLSWSGGKWNTSSKEVQVCTLILIGRKMEYLIKGGSGLYPYPDRAENGWSPQRKRPWWNLRILHNKSDKGFAKGRKMGSLKLEKGLILGVSVLRLKSAFEIAFCEKNDWWFDLEPK